MLTIESDPGGAVVLAGRLDAAQCEAAQAFLDRTSGRVILECARLEYISSAGLGVLLKTQKRLSGDGGGLRLQGVSRHLRDIFQYSGFDRILEIATASE
jgi:anti-anti-sigma factor